MSLLDLLSLFHPFGGQSNVPPPPPPVEPQENSVVGPNYPPAPLFGGRAPANVHVRDSSWEFKNLSEIMFFLDPDGVVKFVADIIAFERTNQTATLTSFMDLLDPDKCPDVYLKFLATAIGCHLYGEDTYDFQRAQIRSAVKRYKLKGLESAFQVFFRSLGYDTEVYPLWFNKSGTVVRESQLTDQQKASDDWRPHARIDIVVLNRLGEISFNIAYLKQRLEEVRPIHVLIRGFFGGVRLNDNFEPLPIDRQTLDLTFAKPDRFRAYGGSPCLTYFYGARPEIRYDGFIPCYYGWQYRCAHGTPPFDAGPGTDPYDTSHAYEDPFSGGPATYGDYEAVGELVRYDNGWILSYANAQNITYGGDPDPYGVTYLYDGAIYNVKYRYDCQFGWETDKLLAYGTTNIIDQAGRVLVYDGELDGYTASSMAGPFYDGAVIPTIDSLVIAPVHFVGSSGTPTPPIIVGSGAE